MSGANVDLPQQITTVITIKVGQAKSNSRTIVKVFDGIIMNIGAISSWSPDYDLVLVFRLSQRGVAIETNLKEYNILIESEFNRIYVAYFITMMLICIFTRCCLVTHVAKGSELFVPTLKGNERADTPKVVAIKSTLMD